MITVLEVRHVANTRKSWQCDGCSRKFPAGTPKLRQRNVGNDGPYSWECCLTCEGISTRLWNLDSDYRHEGVTSDDIQEAMEQEFGSWEAADKHFAAPSTSEKGKDR